MGSFSIWHWVAALAFLGTIAFLIGQVLRKKPTHPSELKGIGGWLAWLAIGQVLGLFQLVLSFALSLGDYGFLSTAYPLRVHIAAYAEIAMGAGYVILVIATTIALFRKKKYFPQLFLCQWITLPALAIVSTAIVTFALGIPSSEVITPKEITSTLVAFGVGGLWVRYTQVSNRVANTMVN
ncbi:UNVERIFIED_ORG: DUF2569 family protein [Roseateles sp. XES5]|nr:DUF2569 family protein [Roseateles sp. XES5]